MNIYDGIAMQGRMPIKRQCGRRGAMGRVFLLIGFLAGGVTLLGAEHASSLEKKVNELRYEVLNDPADSQKQELLGDLQVYLKRQDRQSLDALAKGLEAYLDVGPCAAKVWFQGASQSNYVRHLTQESLGESLESLMGECVPGDTSEIACPGCAGTGWQDCNVCAGTGTRLCQNCEGTGRVVKEGSQEAVVCPKCNGAGARFCMSCNGYGIIKCRKCGGRGYMRSAKSKGIDPKRRAAFQRLIALAGYLYEGGIDFVSGEAMRTTARPSSTTAWDFSGGGGDSSKAANQRLWQELMQRIAGPQEGEPTSEPAR